ncbi:MAG: hypothetical protein J6Z14_02985 [Prevotella sp.]|nr:hypothetical protein [Prevotella sp.]
MKIIRQSGVCLIALFSVLPIAAAQPWKAIERLWQKPTADYRMKTWWFFGYERTDDEGIAADAEALSAAGFGGVVYYDQNHAKVQGEAEDAFSPEWWRHLRRAASEAKRAGLSFELNISNGYCAGGRWIDPAHAMQRVASAQMTVTRDGKGQWLTVDGRLDITGREGYVRDIALIAMPCTDDGKMRHITADYRARGKGRNGAMQGPLEGDGQFTGYGFTPLPDIGVLQVSADSVQWRDVVRLQPMYSSQGGYYVRTNAFPATEGRFWRIHYTGKERLKEWHVGSEAMLDRWEERAALHSDFAEGDDTPDYARQETIDPRECIIRLSPSEDVCRNPASIVPEGADCEKWRILRLAAVLTGAKSKHGRQNLLGYECDKLSAEAANLHWDSYVQVLLDSLPQGTVSGITMDSHEGGSQNWTPRMLDEFRQRQGYDFAPYLPTLAGYVVESAEKTAQVLYDYRQTIASLIRDCYFGTFQQRASALGLTFTAQAIGNALCITGDAISVKQAVDKPQGEFWAYQQHGAYDVKDCSSAAHLYGKPIASAEAMTDCEYRHTPADLHRVASIAFSMGAQEFVVCATPHIPMAEVGQPYIAGREYAINRSNPFWQQMKPVWLQAARSMVMLRQGKAAPDVLIFLGDDVPIKTITSRLPAGIKGLDWDVCTGDALLHRLTARNGQLVTPDGVVYKALLMADKAYASAETKARINAFRNAGVPVLRSGEAIGRPLEILTQSVNVVHTHRRWSESPKRVTELFYLANLENYAAKVRFRLQDHPTKVTVWHNLSGRRTSLKSQPNDTFILSLQPCESVFLTY